LRNCSITHSRVGHGFPQLPPQFVGWAFESELIEVQALLVDPEIFGCLRLVRVLI
jgi:hypothetical protein